MLFVRPYSYARSYRVCVFFRGFIFYCLCLHLLNVQKLQSPHLDVLSFKFLRRHSHCTSTCTCTWRSRNDNTFLPKPKQLHLRAYIRTENRPTITNVDHRSVGIATVIHSWYYFILFISLFFSLSVHFVVLRCVELYSVTSWATLMCSTHNTVRAYWNDSLIGTPIVLRV